MAAGVSTGLLPALGKRVTHLMHDGGHGRVLAFETLLDAVSAGGSRFLALFVYQLGLFRQLFALLPFSLTLIRLLLQ